MRTTSIALAAALMGLLAVPAGADGIGDVELIDLWSRQKTICKEGDEKNAATWIACGRSEAFAAVLAARGMCLDPGQDVWRVGSRTRGGDEAAWRCSLVTS